MDQQTTLDGLTHEQLKELYNKKAQEFYVCQGKNEANINEYLTRIFDLYEKNPGIFAGVEMPCGRTAREVVPAMYEEPFNSERYKEQRKKLMEFQNIMVSRADDICRKELARCL